MAGKVCVRPRAASGVDSLRDVFLQRLRILLHPIVQGPAAHKVLSAHFGKRQTAVQQIVQHKLVAFTSNTQKAQDSSDRMLVVDLPVIKDAASFVAEQKWFRSLRHFRHLDLLVRMPGPARRATELLQRFANSGLLSSLTVLMK
jgi:hypothetical protein